MAPAAIVGVAAFLIRWTLERQADKMRTRIEHDANVQLERIKSSLQITLYEYQIRFSALHNKRCEVLGTLFGYIVEVPFDVNAFILQSPSDYEKAKVAMQKVGELHVFFRKNRIYLPPDLCSLLDEFVQKLRRMVINVGVYWGESGSANRRFREEQMKVMTEAVKGVEQEVPTLTARLETEFRKQLEHSAPQTEPAGQTIRPSES
jgi:hypothetical protein